MRRRIVLSFLAVIVISTILIIFLTIAGLYYFFFSKDIVSSDYPSNFTVRFDQHIKSIGNNIFISEKGKNLLKERNAWLQILDPNGNEIYEFDKPIEAPNHYSPVQIVHNHMYSNSIDGYTLFISRSHNDPNLSYIIGFPSSNISKYTFEYGSSTFGLIVHLILMVLLISLIVFILMGFLFGNKLATPLLYIIDGIEFLAQNKYIIEFQEKGIYGKVYRSLNKLTESLKASKRERDKTERMREEWISNISHDLKTPLSSIKGYAELLTNPEYKISNEEIIKYANIILNKTNYMEELIEDLRLNEKLKNKVLTIEKTKENLTQFLREVIIEILNHPDYENRVIHYNPLDENIEYTFDKNLFERSISNLIYNALIHNDKDTEVIVNLYKNDKIYIEIKDNGKGISEVDLKNLFNRYYRGTNTDIHKGSGLGMSIAKEVIETHGGIISVESEINKGTNIKIIL